MLGRTLLLCGCLPTAFASGQILTPSYDTSTLDRWNYPFNGSPGTRSEIPVFGAIEQPGFDDHDAQALLGFDTSGEIPAGLGAGSYRLLGATLTLTVSNNNDFIYDDSYDSYTTYGAGATDPDAGRPVNVYLTGYRDGFDQTTYGETTAFGFTPDVPPAQGMRRAFAAVYDSAGVATDVSNQLKEQFDAEPLAIGTTDSVTLGDAVPAETVFTFEIAACTIGSGDEFARMLDLGEVRLSVTSLAAAAGGPGGGEGVVYPVFYSRENAVAQILGYTPTLALRVQVGNAADLTGDGMRDFADVSAFLAAFAAGDPLADLTGDCSYDFADVSAFLTAFATP